LEMERLGFRRVKVKGSYYYRGLRVERTESRQSWAAHPDQG